jgi:hypothetical protein
MCLSFARTPPPQRFSPIHGFSPFSWFVLLLAQYLFFASGIIAWLLLRFLGTVADRTTFAALAMILTGSAAEMPLIVIRTIGRWAGFANTVAPQAAFLFSTIRFITIPLGCVLVVLAPAVADVVLAYRKWRITPMWRTVRAVTPQLHLDVKPEWSTADNPWEQLHRCVVEIRDSCFYLLDGWGWPELLEEAAHYADSVSERDSRLIATACWLEVLRRRAESEQPTYEHQLDRTLLPEMPSETSTMREEAKYWVALHRAMQSPQVHRFADRTRRDTPHLMPDPSARDS